MRQLSTVEINRIKLLTENSVEITLIEPTENGLQKSIMDATAPVRNYLKEKLVHNYEIQKQGPENKIQIAANLLTDEGLVLSIASLYRPVTKKGDPRIWFKGLTNYAEANDILGIFEFEKMLYVLNITKLDLKKLLDAKRTNPLQELVREINKVSNEATLNSLAGSFSQVPSFRFQGEIIGWRG